MVNVPSYGTASVSQYSIALLLEICHHIGHHSESVRAGRRASSADWCYWDYPLIELEGKAIGIIGFGRIGQTEGHIARAMGMRVLAFDLYPAEYPCVFEWAAGQRCKSVTGSRQKDWAFTVFPLHRKRGTDYEPQNASGRQGNP